MLTNFWNHLEKQSDKSTLEKYLITKLGQPTNQTQTNLYSEILKKIASYYLPPETNSQQTIYSLLGQVTKLTERPRKTGKHKGQTKYLIEVKESNQNLTIFQAYQENLPANKWKQLTELAILHQNLVFKYKKWITNKELLDFNPQPKKNQVLVSAKLETNSGKAKTG